MNTQLDQIDSDTDVEDKRSDRVKNPLNPRLLAEMQDQQQHQQREQQKKHEETIQQWLNDHYLRGLDEGSQQGVMVGVVTTLGVVAIAYLGYKGYQAYVVPYFSPPVKAAARVARKAPLPTA